MASSVHNSPREGPKRIEKEDCITKHTCVVGIGYNFIVNSSDVGHAPFPPSPRVFTSQNSGFLEINRCSKSPKTEVESVQSLLVESVFYTLWSQVSLFGCFSVIINI